MVLVGFQRGEYPERDKACIQLKDTNQFFRTILGVEPSSLKELKVLLEVRKIVHRHFLPGRVPDPSLNISVIPAQRFRKSTR